MRLVKSALFCLGSKIIHKSPPPPNLCVLNGTNTQQFPHVKTQLPLSGSGQAASKEADVCGGAPPDPIPFIFRGAGRGLFYFLSASNQDFIFSWLISICGVSPMEIGISPFIRLNQQSLMHHVVCYLFPSPFLWISRCFNKRAVFRKESRTRTAPVIVILLLILHGISSARPAFGGRGGRLHPRPWNIFPEKKTTKI